MVKHEKLLDRILRGEADASIPFADLRHLLLRLGFEERIRGSHHVFRRAGVAEKINLQREGNMAKPYQVKQVRTVIIRCRLTEEG
jgi:hypothetical protein